MSDVNDWLKERREFLRLSQEDLARRLQVAGLDVTRATVSHWETGRYNSPLESARAIRALADALEVSVTELLTAAGWDLYSGDLSPKERQAVTAWRRGDRARAAQIILNDS